jgi:ABC-2 type transport system permease protein
MEGRGRRGGRALGKLVVSELRLFLRDPASGLIVIALPVALVAVFGAIAHPRDGHDAIESYFPVMAVTLGLSQMALNLMPTALAGYRERGILRRMATTPVHPARLLGAQLAVGMLLAAVSLVLVVGVGALGFGFDVPRQPAGFLVAFVLGAGALFAVGLFVAAVAPSARGATGIGVGLFFVSLLFGGVFMPTETMPKFMVTIGDYTPLGAAMRTLRASWDGSWPQASGLAVLAAFVAVFGVLSARMFRWE